MQTKRKVLPTNFPDIYMLFSLHFAVPSSYYVKIACIPPLQVIIALMVRLLISLDN